MDDTADDKGESAGPRAAMLLVATMAAFGLSGCFIAPQPLQRDEIVAAVDAESSIRATLQHKALALDLHGAIARALVHNRDLAAEAAGARVALSDLQTANADMLPGLVAGGATRQRSNTPASRSEVIGSPSVSQHFSTSSSRHSLMGDLTFSWSILDFGLSYVRAGQAADKSLIAREQMRRAAIRTAEETRSAFMRAAALQRLDAAWRGVKSQGESSFAGAEKIVRGGQGDPTAALSFQREMLATAREIEQTRRALLGADIQLKTLAGLPPGQQIVLLGRGVDQPPDLRTPLLGASLDTLADAALTNRPEIRQLALEGRISRAEAVAAMLALLPGVNLSASASGDASRYLLHGNWISWGAQASWNLIRLLHAVPRREQAALREDHVKARGLAAAAAVLMQVHIAHLRYAHAMAEHAAAGRAAGVQSRLTALAGHNSRVGRAPPQAAVRERMLLVLAEVRRDVALAEAHAAYAALVTAIGADPLDYGALDGADVQTVRRFLDEAARESDATAAVVSPSKAQAR